MFRTCNNFPVLVAIWNSRRSSEIQEITSPVATSKPSLAYSDYRTSHNSSHLFHSVMHSVLNRHVRIFSTSLNCDPVSTQAAARQLLFTSTVLTMFGKLVHSLSQPESGFLCAGLKVVLSGGANCFVGPSCLCCFGFCGLFPSWEFLSETMFWNHKCTRWA